jgi:hypothetical protein
MIDNLLNELKINHIGIIINPKMKRMIEKESGNCFIEDTIQGVSVCFVWDELMQVHREYITNEGRAAAHKLGFNHVCYDIESKELLQKLHNFILKNRLGIRLTLPEPSPTEQCNIVSFYKIVGIGIVEFNILT